MGGAPCVAAIQTAGDGRRHWRVQAVLISVGRTGYSGARVSTRLQQFPQFALANEFEAPIGMFAPASSTPRARAATWSSTAPRLGISPKSPW